MTRFTRPTTSDVLGDRSLGRSSVFAVAVFLSGLLCQAPSAAHALATQSPRNGGDEQSEEERDTGLLPSLQVYFPEGEFDFRLGRLVRNAFFEGQLRYDVPNGDLTAFVRSRYYGFRRTYQLTVFDAIEFEDLEAFSNDFERVRGALFLVNWPHDSHRRTTFLAELDAISSNKEEFRFTTDKTNLFLRLGYQLGTPDDTRSNAIVGESRAEVEPLFTAHREIGPGGRGLTVAATASDPSIGSDFEYTRVQLVGLQRFDLFPRSFLIGRFDLGSFPSRREIRDDPALAPRDRLAIPIQELFRLDGRENLKGLDEDRHGTEKLVLTTEWFVPWFIDSPRKALGLTWTSWYWIGYAGLGSVGFERRSLTRVEDYVADLGLGFESSVSFKSFRFFVSALVAQALESGNSPQLRISLKTYR